MEDDYGDEIHLRKSFIEPGSEIKISEGSLLSYEENVDDEDEEVNVGAYETIISSQAMSGSKRDSYENWMFQTFD